MVKVMDGHFDDQTWWPRSSAEEPFHHYHSLQLFGGKDAACLETGTSGRAWQDFILDSLPEKIRKKREKSKKYKEVGLSFSILFCVALVVKCNSKSLYFVYHLIAE